ncbi:MAG: SagB/ThcOx family dehydrogenase [Verrucomicrobiae bacterium]|nr:SagB/ThcOx family dehydrogenase [Verrucomicrobiae bacterium]
MIISYLGRITCLFASLLVFFLIPTAIQAENLKTIDLPPPHQSGGKPLMEVLKARQSIREFSSAPLPLEVISDLLWSGFGINRPDTDHRTAPSAMNMQEIDIYITTQEGLFLYKPKPHQLQPVVSGDLRNLTTGQLGLQEAPVAMIFVADYRRMTKAKPDDREFYTAIDTGFIVQNIYLYCASAGLATVVHELDRSKLLESMKLHPEQKIIIAQAVGYPKTGGQ